MPLIVSSIEKCYQRTVFSIGVGMGAYATLSFFASYTGKVLSSMNVMDRYVVDFWNGLLIPPTNFNTNFLILFSLFAFVVTQVQSWKKLTLLLLTASGILVAFGTATRTNLFIIVFSFAMLVIFDITYEHKILKKPTSKFRTSNLVACLFAIGLMVLLTIKYGGQIENLVQKLFASMSYRISNYVNVADDPRWYSWSCAFIGLFSYPFGNNTAMQMEAHNLILEAGRRTGVIPFVLLFAFVLKVLKNCFELAKNHSVEYKTRLLVFLITTSTMAAMMIEPVFVGRPFIFIYLSLIWGMTECTRSSCHRTIKV